MSSKGFDDILLRAKVDVTFFHIFSSTLCSHAEELLLVKEGA